MICRTAIESEIADIEGRLKQLAPAVDHSLGLSSDLGINSENQLVNEDGELLYEIREEIPADDTAKEKGKQKADSSSDSQLQHRSRATAEGLGEFYLKNPLV